MKYALRFHFLFDISKLLLAYKHTYFVQRNRMKCGHSRNLIYVPFFFDIWKLLVAYKHTYFVQRNRMKCGHSRNLIYVSRSCFSFDLHTFVTHLNKWNTRWDFIFIWHLKTACVRPPALAALQRNRMKCGRRPGHLFYGVLDAVFHFIYTLLWPRTVNTWNAAVTISFSGRHLKTTCGI